MIKQSFCLNIIIESIPCFLLYSDQLFQKQDKLYEDGIDIKT